MSSYAKKYLRSVRKPRSKRASFASFVRYARMHQSCASETRNRQRKHGGPRGAPSAICAGRTDRNIQVDVSRGFGDPVFKGKTRASRQKIQRTSALHMVDQDR